MYKRAYKFPPPPGNCAECGRGLSAQEWDDEESEWYSPSWYDVNDEATLCSVACWRKNHFPAVGSG